MPVVTPKRAAGCALRCCAVLCCALELALVAMPGAAHAQSDGHWAQVVRPGTAAAAPTTAQAAPTPTAPADPLTQRGWRLRAEIDATYQQLRATRTLTQRVDQTNDVTPVVQKYIPVGTSFDDAAAILRAAGCSIGVKTNGHGYATLAMRDGLLQAKHTFAIDLVPRTANDFSVIGDVGGIIFENHRIKSDLK
jgi:hypothetical protein